MAGTKVVIIGAGIVGLSLALEMSARGWEVTVVERNGLFAGASRAAAGMLAEHDPHNPRALRPLAEYSAAAYPEFLRRIELLSGVEVPFQTHRTVQHDHPGGPVRLAEHSVDPRQLGSALEKAIRASAVRLCPYTALQLRDCTPADAVVQTTGAWFSDGGVVFPCKGQMLRVQLPAGRIYNEVHRCERVYFVPRTQGPQAGTALVGATVENVGFDTTVCEADLRRLRGWAAEWIPAIASAQHAPTVEAWAGLRPATRDGLPLLGELSYGIRSSQSGGSRRFVATGHFRNGILLAPGTALAMGDLIEGMPLAIDIAAYEPHRAALGGDRTLSPIFEQHG